MKIARRIRWHKIHNHLFTLLIKTVSGISGDRESDNRLGSQTKIWFRVPKMLHFGKKSKDDLIDQLSSFHADLNVSIFELSFQWVVVRQIKIKKILQKAYIIKLQHVMQSICIKDLIRMSCPENFGSGRVLTSDVRVAKYPTRYSPIYNVALYAWWYQIRLSVRW